MLVAVLLVVALAATFGLRPGTPGPDVAAAASSCSDYATQAAAQAAADTRDADGDGIYCESLPCPCAGKSPTKTPSPSPAPPSSSSSTSGTAADPKGCRVVKNIVDVGLSKTKYPKVRGHWELAIKRGWPRVLTIHRKGAEQRRNKLLKGIPTAPGKDRDEYPPAAARTTVKADVQLVDSGQNRGAGQVQGVKLRRYCSGQRFRFVWY